MNDTDPRPAPRRQARADRTRNAILKSAQHLFATRGYTETGVRDIAAKAKVNPALITRYFGSKLELFEVAVESSLTVTLFTQAPREDLGESIASALCGAGREASNVVPALVFAAGDSKARKTALRLLKKQVIEPLKLWFGEPEAEERAAQIMTVVTGFFTYRFMLPLDILKDTPTPAMHRWLAQTLQEIVDR